MSETLAVVVLLVVGYLVGSFPSGVVYGKLGRGVDVRWVGSGNPGATNTLRALGWKFALAVGLTDILKGVLPVVLARLTVGLPLAEVAAAFGAIAGHNWSLALGFRGGRGVATSIGTFLVIAPLPALVAVLAFVLVVWRTRYVSLGSILAAVVALLAFLAGVLLGWRPPGEYYVYTIAGALLLIIRHADNIQRLRAGVEPRLGEPLGRPRVPAP